ncbi:hypothetical protein SteCoe_27296 [Stentor coeruleus]|uniref:PX domain-containing protein n=1 Tax=Stentor coeruleus TaxID=5963 RepID=A0A1R2BAX4_9CILI|nr:hypothetical protein SteCoe_27296 [Stentor coeruleus]
MSLQVTFKEYKIVDKHAEYLIEVRDLETDEVWTFCRRYSVMHNWHKKSLSSVKSLPKFPKKKFFGNLKPKFLDKRKGELENYINSILPLSENQEVLDFIKPSDRELCSQSLFKNDLTSSDGKSIRRYRSVTGQVKELVIDMASLTSKSEVKTNPYGDLKENLAIVILKSLVPNGHDENIENLYGDGSVQGHWIRKKFRKFNREHKTLIEKDLLINNFLN